MSIALGEDEVTVEDVAMVARRERSVHLAEQAEARLLRARDVVERWSRENRPAYGLTRGLGARAMTEISQEDRGDFSMSVVRARATGGGGYLEPFHVRAALFARAASLAQGGGGVRPLIVHTQLAMLERGVHPLVPQVGSLGASDLALCANMALPLVGEGRAEFEGEILPGDEAMRRAKIPTIGLLEKEGLALCSANSISIGLGALVLHELIDLSELADAILALSFEAFRGNPSPFDARVVASRPAPGQHDAAVSLRRMLRGTKLFDPAEPRRLQDPISLRCATQVHGALRATIDFARPNVEIELNSASDNPLILADEDLILSTGNFHAPAMAVAFDALRLALAEVSTMSSERVSRLMQSELTGLPDRFNVQGPSRTGLGLIRVAARSLNREVRFYSTPASNDDNTSDSVEDQAPFTPVAVRRALEQINYIRQVFACELIVAAQALELRQLDTTAAVARTLLQTVRAVVDRLDDDRSTTLDIERVTELIRNGTILTAVRRTLREDDLG